MSIGPIQRKATIYYEPNDVFAQLDRLGLTRGVLEMAVTQGEAQRRLGSNLDPKPAPGFTAWSRTIRVLREGLIEFNAGWYPEDWVGIPMIVNADETIRLTATSGDENTGRPETGIDPRTKNPKGGGTAEAVAENAQQSLDIPGPTTWVLLYDSTADGLFAELACPEALAANGYIEAWTERIILGHIDLGDSDAQQRDVPEPPADSPNVSVLRRIS
jgi:hypothetical protein